MNVLLISQCSKRALTETRRILDQFAERKGERTWQTAITQAGLDTLRKLLRQTARKNTAVACHRIGGKNHSELLWFVGDARQFNDEGTVPTNTTASDVLRADDENTWHSLRLIQQLTALAALMHDLGKASDAFQSRLNGALKEKNLYRHEWASVRIFQAFVTSCGLDGDDAWLQALANAKAVEHTEAWLQQWMGDAYLLRDGQDGHITAEKNPFAVLPPLAQAVAWLILTHHRLPAVPYSATEMVDTSKPLYHGRKLSVNPADLLRLLQRVNADWNEPFHARDAAAVAAYWRFSKGLPVSTEAWRGRAARAAQALLRQATRDTASPSDTVNAKEQHAPQLQCLNNPYVMQLSRLALMLADHYYSGLADTALRVAGEKNYPLFANTDRKTGQRLQRLDEHLLGVEHHASQLVHALPSFSRQLAHLRSHRGLKKRSENARFRWQDKAADLAVSVRDHAAEHGAFIVNMASTGCGKTLGNARIMNALANPQHGLRCAFAMGLRTLTLQTGRSFQQDLGLGDDELAIQVGGAASRELFAYYEAQAEKTGSASSQGLLDESSHVVFEGNDQHPLLHHLGHDGAARKLLAAPLLVCTVDHLTPATESLRGGKQIAPMLRLMSGDLVLDEPDDFDIADLPALTRLVHWAGLLGARVLLSSATLPPALVEGLFQAYCAGRKSYQHNRSARPLEAPRIACLWVDEFHQHHAECADASSFAAAHAPFVAKRSAKLAADAQANPRKWAQLLAMPTDFQRLTQQQRHHSFAQLLQGAALALHRDHHSIDPATTKRISFGLIRMANIAPLVEVALALFALGAPQGVCVHLCVYHSQFPLFARSAIEQRLDAALNRRQENAVFEIAEIRQAIDAHDEADQLFIVLGSPVTEVGRDHDYDWAVVEPSSMRSLIQLAGRVLRHRTGKPVAAPNILICDSNLRHFEQPGKPAFCRPGFESLDFPLKPHQLQALLSHLLDARRRLVVDATPRILPRPAEQRSTSGSLVDLEHTRMEKQMLPPAPHTATGHRRKSRSAAAPAPIATSSTSLPAPPAEFNASTFWHWPTVQLTAAMQQSQVFRQDNAEYVDLVLRPNEDEDGYLLYRVAEGEKKWEQLYVLVDGALLQRIADSAVNGPGIAPWGHGDGHADFWQAMQAQAEAMEMPVHDFAKRYATASLRVSTQGWRWHPALGFATTK
ncbi:type I-F CRISPR-associated helicase Cas3 [Corticibacter populi]|uniref:Type I-F CRISPR-associated helicase Cas3 n=1 Tax=Corticibacter populi TaxID=1550736 RepID=A0A3M6QVY3_9BURK|nr:type I-F CRISPR-associated helicase Cas3f [Corticibacter populi]RMX06662.1 type I-F CRISPR-associated helicase Cas3 [Corticibacter populi]RZS31763.1 CRISPR-associated Cas3 family helicase [Corticibacter populi]